MKDARQFTNYKKAVASREVILLATMGSTVLGLEQQDSDIDEMGICLETPEDLIGFSTFEQTIYRTAQDRTGKFDAKSEPGDIDLTIYGLRKFVRLALGGNPNLVNMLFLEPKHCSVFTPLAGELHDLRSEFIAKNTLKAFLGYAKAQRLKLNASRGVTPNQPTGYDYKYAMHYLRLSMQAYQLVNDGYIRFPMQDDYLRKLRGIRRGDYSIGDVLDSGHSYERAIEGSLNDSNDMPESPNYKAIEKWLLGVYNAKWQERPKSAEVKRTPTAEDPTIQF